MDVQCVVKTMSSFKSMNVFDMIFFWQDPPQPLWKPLNRRIACRRQGLQIQLKQVQSKERRNPLRQRAKVNDCHLCLNNKFNFDG